MRSDILEFAVLIPTSLIHILLGTLVFFNRPKSATNRLFFLLSALIVMWGITNYISVHPPSPQSALFWIRLVMFFAAPLSVTLLLLIHTFPQSAISLGHKQFAAAIAATAATMAVALSPFLFTSLRQGSDGSFAPQPGPGMALFVPVGIGSIIAAMIVLVRKLLRSEGALRAQMRYLFLGITAFWGLVIVTIFVPVVFFNFSGFVPFSSAWSLAFSAATAYAIVRHRLLDIRVASTAALLVTLMLLLLFRLITSNSLEELLLNGFALAGTGIIGYFLARSVVFEIQRREKVEKLFGDLEKSFSQLKELDDTKTEFLSIASHQLRAPLTAIKGFLSMLKEGDFGSVTGEQKGAIDTMTEAEDHVMGLVDDYLNFSRIEAGHTQLNLSQVDIRKLVAAVVEQLRPLALQKNITLSFTGGSEPVITSCDGEKLHQICTNLTENAIKYTDQGEVAVSLTHNEKEIIIAVRDTGRGIAPQEHEFIFKKFTRGKEAIKNSKGTGLGLYIAQEFAKAHGGRIVAQSPGLGKGSTFSIILPKHPPSK